MKNKNELNGLVPALLVFIKTVETGNFSATARMMSMTPSSVSRMIDRLEERLNQRLLIRTTRMLQVTECGQEIYHYALKVISATDDLFSRAESFSDTPRGTLRITAPNTLGKILLTPFLPEFLRNYPNINVVLSLTDRIVNIAHDQFDLALRITEAPPENMVARVLMRIDYSLVCSKIYHQELPKDLSSLSAHNIFFSDEQQFHGGWVFRKREHCISVSLTPRLMINNSDVMLDAILQGVGIALLPTFIANIYITKGLLQKVLPEWRFDNPFPRNAYVITLPQRLLPLKTKAFIDDFMQWLKQRECYQRITD
ncbi:LysR family transcriptional regulator [Xenorhabdus bovienii]|uniref:LysR family transcriptional regulator n=1 Tax=Xenorhabdus bovienii TaxID=40576 RepID=UPI0023B2B251|nr:LysR family transcriptional regulator [Xenorhabdus bovienii]MDE9481569.1 LysR family transcriptional regulator [Xenorhabdus bovienii]MDE9542181.1 LysR family transcriptional regulator [Xenorhabdus bovienii]MDE9550137.1 LysR family transcriptional regulator [Xenorhabdus bovienii]MDE9555078.1 LysR family transcriptional regulator [Xenorhabdus bovienii]MDE9564582.1 LysR family transcriptional regulator [Xenorhabdus bovienii]